MKKSRTQLPKYIYIYRYIYIFIYFINKFNNEI